MNLQQTLHGVAAVALVVLSSPGLGATTPHNKQLDEDRSLVVEDRKCERLVAPYDMEGNARKSVTALVKTTTSKGSAWLKDKFARATGDKPQLTKSQERKQNEKTKNELQEASRTEIKRGNWLPMSTEVEYGQRAHEQSLSNVLDRDSKVGKQLYAVADNLMSELQQGIHEPHAYTFQLFVREESTTNALARPGGFLYLDAGLLKDSKQHAKARFALAHEIAHVLQRHETRELQGLIVDSYEDEQELEQAIAKSKAHKGQPGDLLAQVKMSKGRFIRHTMDQELQADACSLRLIYNAYPGGAELQASTKAFLDDLNKKKTPAKHKTEPEFPEMARELVTLPADRHPSSQERSANLRSMQKELLTADP